MTSANYMQVAKCECGSEDMCFCGRCRMCGKQRNEEATLVGKFKKRWTQLLDLHAREKILQPTLDDTRRIADDLFRCGLMSQQDFANLVEFFTKNYPVQDETVLRMKEFRLGLLDEQEYSKMMDSPRHGNSP